MILVTVITPAHVRVNVGPFEHYAVRVAAPNGGFEWIFDGTHRRVGFLVRRAIEQAVARASSGVSPPS